MYILHLFVTLFASIFCICADYAFFGAILDEWPKLHLQMVLFGTNLMSNISTKASK